jgi:hypothetical protein
MNCYNKTVEGYSNDLEELQKKPIEVIKITLNEPLTIIGLISIGI